MKFIRIRKLIITLATIHCAHLSAAEPVQLKSVFNPDDVKWIQTHGTSSISGTAFLRLNEKEQKGCAGFGIELLPVADYSNERIFNIYGNNLQGQVLLKNNPPKFTPDHPQYHELVRKSKCDESNNFTFKDLPAGEYYVIAFIIWKDKKGQEDGGALMKRVSLRKADAKSIKM